MAWKVIALGLEAASGTRNTNCQDVFFYRLSYELVQVEAGVTAGLQLQPTNPVWVKQ
jgi:hypothetical protein